MLALRARMQESIIGQEQVIERLLLTLLCNGHLLLEGLPGLAKTRSIKALARNLECSFRRIQFTPDLLPADITGSEIYYEDGGKSTFKFQPGPLFGNLVLADEINRAGAKVQAALLEGMEERQVTVAGTTHELPDLFMVLATQNPIEQEGTYPLPEAQMDRFLMHVTIGYPDDAAELQVLRLVRGEERADAAGATAGGPDLIAQSAIFAARSEIQATPITEPVERYIVDLIGATRRPERYGDRLKGWIQIGASPRGTIAIDRAARAHAWLRGRDFVSPDDVRAITADCLRHRLTLSYEAVAEGVRKDDVIAELVRQVAVA